MTDRIQIQECDITTLDVDAIVNAANTKLLGGGGVDGAIHHAAGPSLLEECRKTNGCPTGEARLTGGHGLHARHIIHTAGPVWNDGEHDEPALLANCYRNSLQMAAEHNFQTLAFPAISCGAYRFPLEAACYIALREITAFLQKHDLPETIILACFDEPTANIYRKLAKQNT